MTGAKADPTDTRGVRQREVLVAYLKREGIITDDAQLHGFQIIYKNGTRNPPGSSSGDTVGITVQYRQADHFVLSRDIPYQVLKDFQMNMQRDLAGKPNTTRPAFPRGPLNGGWEVNTPQDTLTGLRTSVLQTVGIAPDVNRYVSARRSNGMVVGLNCSCLADHKTLCKHLIYAYFMGLDRGPLVNDMGGGEGRIVDIPIGLGMTNVKVRISTPEDVEAPKPLANTLKAGTGYARVTSDLASKLMPGGAVILLSPTDGLLKVIRTYEDVLRTTQVYDGFRQMRNPAPSTSPCKGRHLSPSARAHYVAMVRPENKLFDAWAVANAASVVEHKRCLACMAGMDGTAHIPEV